MQEHKMSLWRGIPVQAESFSNIFGDKNLYWLRFPDNSWLLVLHFRKVIPALSSKSLS